MVFVSPQILTPNYSSQERSYLDGLAYCCSVDICFRITAACRKQQRYRHSELYCVFLQSAVSCKIEYITDDFSITVILIVGLLPCVNIFRL